MNQSTKSATPGAPSAPVMETINNWNPEVDSLLTALVAAGFTLAATDNGEDRVKIKTQARALSELTACDEASLYVTHPSNPARRIWISLVLGNSPGELVSDYATGDTDADKLLTATVSAHGDSWEGKAQPTITRPRGW